jgi:hypothetical protein
VTATRFILVSSPQVPKTSLPAISALVLKVGGDDRWSTCSLEFISTVYQLWYNIFLSQQNNISRLIRRKNHQPNSLKQGLKIMITIGSFFFELTMIIEKKSSS